MPTLFLKLIALSGVITAGCFAVWKANTELQPAVASDPTQFTSVEGEDKEKSGLVAERGTPPASDNPLVSSKESDDDVTDLTQVAAEDSGESEVTEMDQTLAMADHPFAGGAGADEPAEARSMPLSFPPEQDEPVTDVATEDTSSLEPGVASLEALEKAEQNQKKAIETEEVEGASTATATDEAPLRRVPQAAGAPALMRIRPNPMAASQPVSGKTVPAPVRDRNPQRVVQANSEVDVSGSEEANAPGAILLPSDQEEPAGTNADTPTILPERRPLPGRTRAVPNPEPIPGESATEGGGNFFEQEGPVALPSAEDGAAATGNFPAEDGGATPRIRSNQPTPIEKEDLIEEQSEPASSIPAHAEPGNRELPHGNAAGGAGAGRSSIPSSIPHKAITEEMLIGDATVEDQQMTPSQQPQLRIEKRAQAEAEVGVKFIYEIHVENVGQATARNVLVEERIPKGCKMLRSSPVAKLGTDRILRWQLDDLVAGASKVIKVEVQPLEAGPVGSVATVRFAAEVATKTIVTAPTLSLSVVHPPEVAVGEKVPVKFEIKNTGTGVARNASLRALLQEGLDHPVGLDIDQEPWSLAPGQTKVIDLVLTAVDPGRYTPSVIVMANGIEQENRTLDLSVIESRLTLSREGHARRFVNRPAEFVTTVKNHSVEVMKGVIITERLPEGVTPVGEIGKGLWNPKDRTVTWTVSELRPEQYSELKLTVVSAKAGNLTGKVEAVDAAGHRAELPTQLEVQGFSALTLDFQGDGKAVAVGDQVSMRVTVGNKGSAPAKGVQAVFEVPPQMAFVDAKGPSTFQRDGNMITFAELEELDPNTSQTYDIVLTAAQEGTPAVGVELMSAERPEPVRQEEVVTITPAL